MPLRITGHRGPISVVEGADGRIRPVGDGINLCGSLINFGAKDRVVVTSAFRNFAIGAALVHGAEVDELGSMHQRRQKLEKHPQIIRTSQFFSQE